MKIPFRLPQKALTLIFGVIFILIFGGVGFAAHENRAAVPQKILPVATENKASQTPPIVIEVYSSHVFIKTPEMGDFEEITSSKNVPAGTIVKTDGEGRAQALYPNHSVTRLDHGSEFTIENFNEEPFQAEVKLSKGKIWSRITKLLGQEKYETKSDNLVASIRGTSYGHNIMANGQDTIIVAEGKVNGDCLKVEQGADVDKGQEASYPCAQGGDIVQRFMSDLDKQDEWYLFNQTEDQKLNDMYGLGIYTGVLGVAVTPTPKPTQKPKPSPTATNTPTPTSSPTSTTASTSTPTPAPDPVNTTDNSTQTPTITITPTPSPTPTPADTTGPTITNFDANPKLIGLDQQVCSVSFRADASDPSGINYVKVLWQSYDANGAIASSSGTIAMTNDGSWYGSGPMSVPGGGTVEWSVESQDNLSNTTASPSGITISADARGCP